MVELPTVAAAAAGRCATEVRTMERARSSRYDTHCCYWLASASDWSFWLSAVRAFRCCIDTFRYPAVWRGALRLPLHLLYKLKHKTETIPHEIRLRYCSSSVQFYGTRRQGGICDINQWGGIPLCRPSLHRQLTHTPEWLHASVDRSRIFLACRFFV